MTPLLFTLLAAVIFAGGCMAARLVVLYRELTAARRVKTKELSREQLRWMADHCSPDPRHFTDDPPPQFKEGQSVNITGGIPSEDYVRELRGG